MARALPQIEPENEAEPTLLTESAEAPEDEESEPLLRDPLKLYARTRETRLRSAA